MLRICPAAVCGRPLKVLVIKMSKPIIDYSLMLDRERLPLPLEYLRSLTQPLDVTLSLSDVPEPLTEIVQAQIARFHPKPFDSLRIQIQLPADKHSDTLHTIPPLTLTHDRCVTCVGSPEIFTVSCSDPTGMIPPGLEIPSIRISKDETIHFKRFSPSQLTLEYHDYPRVKMEAKKGWRAGSEVKKTPKTRWMIIVTYIMNESLFQESLTTLNPPTSSRRVDRLAQDFM